MAAFAPNGELLQQAAVRHKPDVDGQNADHWWRDTTSLIGELLSGRVTAKDVVGVSLCGRAAAGVFLDRAGEVLVHPWDDQRHASELARLRAWRADGRHLANYGAALVAKFLWLRHQVPDVANRCRYALYAKDFVLFRLTGAHMTDWSSGPDAPEWHPELHEHFDLPPDLLPAPALPWQIAGRLTAAAARETGLTEGIPVAVGAHDGICANVGAGATRPGEYAITLGTHAVVRTPSVDPPADAYRFYSLPPDRHIIGGNAIQGGRSVDWLLDITRAGDQPDAYASAAESAAAIDAGADGVRFLPFLSGQVAPELRPAASGAFLGLALRHGKAALLRAVLEGVSFAIADIVDQIVGWCGPPTRVRLTGGGATSKLWPHILAAVLDTPLECSDEAVEGRGAAIFLAVALGLQPDYDAAADAMVPSARRIAADADAVVRYRDVRWHWRQVRDATRVLDDL